MGGAELKIQNSTMEMGKAYVSTAKVQLVHTSSLVRTRLEEGESLTHRLSHASSKHTTLSEKGNVTSGSPQAGVVVTNPLLYTHAWTSKAWTPSKNVDRDSTQNSTVLAWQHPS